tara:strand:+ start:10912 stop:11928 length:1017 start_codon:yes stop_codon:yes gene_type:complete
LQKVRAADLIAANLVVDFTVPATPLEGYLGGRRGLFHLLDQYRDAGVGWISLTAGLDHYPSIDFTVRQIAALRAMLADGKDRYMLAASSTEVSQAGREGRLAVSLAFQGTAMLMGDLAMVEAYRTLGVTVMLLAYNDRNPAADGCMEPENAGLSKFGRRLVEAMNKARVLVDLTHTGERSALEAAEASAAPVVYSHSNPSALLPHPRNISDAQIVSCAATGGVIGINGVGMFLTEGGDEVTAELLFRQVDHIADKAGIRHVGLGLDYVDTSISDILHRIVETSGDRYDSNYQRPAFAFASPQIIVELVECMLVAGYSHDDIGLVLGGNFSRVYTDVVG